MIYSALLGLITGLVCVGGIALSLKIFFKLAGDEQIPSEEKKILALKGLAYFLGQFVMAIGAVILLGHFSLRQGPFVAGLLSMNLIIPFLIHYYSEKKDKN